MEWWLLFLIIFGGLIVLMVLGLPVAFCFLLVNELGVYFLWGGEIGLRQFILSIFSSVTTFTLLPIPLFILMGEVMFLSGVAPNMVDALDKWLGAIPGRLSLLAVAAGTLFATLSGASIGSTAMLGSVMLPEMEKRGYKKPMTLGPILGSGGLATMIPPTGLGILLAAIAEISIGKLLIAIIIPGLLMALLYAAYIVGRCWLQPSLAPPYAVSLPPLSEKLIATARYILPLGLVIFLVIGVMLLGIATPSEAAATGALSCFILAAAYRKLTWELVRKSVDSTLRIAVMVLMILTGAKAFSQILAYTGASKELANLAVGLPIAPILVIIAMQAVLIFLGMFISATAMIMITMPIFMPVVHALGFDPVWFGVITLLNVEMATTSPPFGMSLFVMKAVAPPDTTMGDIYRAALPFLCCDAVAMALIIAFPSIALWLPSIAR